MMPKFDHRLYTRAEEPAPHTRRAQQSRLCAEIVTEKEDVYLVCHLLEHNHGKLEIKRRAFLDGGLHYLRTLHHLDEHVLHSEEFCNIVEERTPCAAHYGIFL